MIQRYELSCAHDDENSWMEKDDEGCYVNYTDHLAEIAKKDEEIYKLRTSEAEVFMLMEQAENKYVEAKEQLDKLRGFANDLLCGDDIDLEIFEKAVQFDLYDMKAVPRGQMAQWYATKLLTGEE